MKQTLLFVNHKKQTASPDALVTDYSYKYLRNLFPWELHSLSFVYSYLECV